MFLRDINGFLINISVIERINIEINETYCMVVARLKDDRKITLFKNIELQHAQNYLEGLSRKIAVNFEVWEI